MIPYYPANCDYYGRARKAGLFLFDQKGGRFFDVADCISDTCLLFASDEPSRKQLEIELAALVRIKSRRLGVFEFWKGDRRNMRQGKNRDNTSPDFGVGFELQIKAGRKWFESKWGSKKCNF